MQGKNLNLLLLYLLIYNKIHTYCAFILQLVSNLIMTKFGLDKNEAVFNVKNFYLGSNRSIVENLVRTSRCGKSDPNFQRCPGQLEVVPLQDYLIQNVLAQDL